MPSVTIQNTPAPGFKLDAKAIRDALELLGADSLPYPVRVKLSNGQRTRGCTRWNEKNPHEKGVRITVSRNLSAIEATKTLWHEFTHLAQMARIGSAAEFAREYRKYSATGYGYSGRYERNPFEIEARENAEQFADIPLTVEV